MKAAIFLSLSLCFGMAVQSMQAGDVYVYKRAQVAPVLSSTTTERITFDSNGINLLQSDGTTLSAAFDTFNYFSFVSGQEPTAVQSVKTNQAGLTFDGTMLMLGDAQSAAVYTASGLKVVDVKAGTGKVSLSHLPAGIYLVKATINGQSVTSKIVKK